VALLPVSGTYVMSPLEAAEAARRIDPAVAVPMHWGTVIGSASDADAFAKAAPVEVEILERVG
jgi:L-ascorbate metabolism protein UlaG (beta-lactamase superfamily)